jgi:RelA/SpoT family (p)ppGpp synthetase
MQQYSFFQQLDTSKEVSSIDTLSSSLQSYLAPAQVNNIKRAYYYAEQAHEGQRRRSGEAYVTHPLAVATILSNMHMDYQSLMAAMLHDVIEDTGISKAAMTEQFGETVAELVDGVSKLTRMEDQTLAEAQAENFQKMALAMAKDIRVILVKLADRLHNMRTLGVLKSTKRSRIARETLDIYAPIAQRLGMHSIRVEFEDLSFAALYPMRSRRIAAAVKSVRGNRNEIVTQIRESIEACLEREEHKATVLGREKHLYSIYQKMRSKKKSFSEIMDLYAFRIVVDSVDTCYRVLGCIHSLYKPVPGQFKDYIAIPKSNGYQSLHTVLFGMHGVPIEIQIRTAEMEEMANYGIAAHWLYKTNDDEIQNSSHARARQWLTGLLEMQQRAGDSLEFIENVKIDLFPDEVYVFTPKGKIMELPQGATAVDFAYAVHTDVGNHCVACRINRRLAPLSEQLQSGQTVDIITSINAQPSPAWLNFVVTGKTRTNIRHFLKSQRQTESITLGRRLLEKDLNALSSSIEELDDQQKQRLLNDVNINSFEKILEEIGMGNRVSFLTAHQLLTGTDEKGDINQTTVSKQRQPLSIRGSEGFQINFARCCFPIPGDEIIGFISSERGVVVHTDRCHNSQDFRKNPERSVSLRWDNNVEGEFSVELHIELENSRGIIAVLATKINSLDANIEKISVEEEGPHVNTVNVVVGVHSRIHLARIMKHLRTIKAVLKVTRTKH